MQVSVESTSSLERRLTIDVPAADVDNKVNERLREAQKNLRINGFRPGKVPLQVVKQRYGSAVRNEVLADVMRDTYTQAVAQEKLEPAGMPGFEAVTNEAGQDLRYVATLEVFPEVELGAFDSIAVERLQSEIVESDVDEMIEKLRSQRAEFEEVERAAADGDRVVIDYLGRKDGEAFDGGTADGQRLELGSNSMIPGFEAGIVGHKAGEEFVVPVTFPEDYQAEELKGQAVEFTITLHNVEAKALPEVDAEFMKAFGVEDGDADKFRAEIKSNMERELKQAVEGKTKQQVMDGLVELHTFELPKALIDGEISRMRQQMMQQFGGGQQFDASMLPDDLFATQAERSVRLGLIVRQIVSQHELEADADAVKARIEEIAAQYDDKEAVTSYFFENAQQLQQIEGMVLEQQVVDKVLSEAQLSDKTVDYKDAVAAAGEQ